MLVFQHHLAARVVDHEQPVIAEHGNALGLVGEIEHMAGFGPERRRVTLGCEIVAA